MTAQLERPMTATYELTFDNAEISYDSKLGHEKLSFDISIPTCAVKRWLEGGFGVEPSRIEEHIAKRQRHPKIDAAIAHLGHPEVGMRELLAHAIEKTTNGICKLQGLEGMRIARKGRGYEIHGLHKEPYATFTVTLMDPGVPATAGNSRKAGATRYLASLFDEHAAIKNDQNLTLIGNGKRDFWKTQIGTFDQFKTSYANAIMEVFKDPQESLAQIKRAQFKQV